MQKLKNYSPIIIVAGQSKSIFYEIFLKSIKIKKFKSPIILISSKKLLIKNMRKFKLKKKIKSIRFEKLKKENLDNNSINLIEVDSKKNEYIDSNRFIKNSFSIAFKIIKSGLTNKFINGPITKKKFLKKKYLGITEYISENFSVKKSAMLIYNKNLSVCPITTHLPLKLVSKKINQKLILEKVELIHNFYFKNFKLKPRIAILGLNPHCESIDNYNEDEKVIAPAIKKLKKLKYKVSGPHPADTIFLRQNRVNYDVIVGIYHDQVLTPIKTLFEYDAINITLGLPFIRISPDHGPNEKMLNKNNSNPLSLIKAISFLDKN